ncbi:MAG: amidohydrolase [Verrucomicrobia bacterium]|nr:amidohydrolase [Verrucomicrobiota bacterium]
MNTGGPISRRTFLAATALVSVSPRPGAQESKPEPIIDIHQHTNYHGRTDGQMLAHQRAMGITTTILLPAGRVAELPSTHAGRSNGLAARCGGNEWCKRFADEHPGEFLFAANEITDHPEARAEVEKYLKLGAKMIAEQKFGVACDSASSQDLYRLAQDHGVPVLLHFQHGTYNLGYERFHKVLENFPKVNFLGHAQTVWANIDRDHADQKNLYPKTKVTAGGLTDVYLRTYPNFFADMSAGSGLNALIRDEDHTRGFLDRHQSKILYGSDCADTLGRGPGCQGAQTLAALRRLAPNAAALRKILFENSRKLFRLA